MAREIERKYLVLNESWRASIERSERYLQGYLANGAGCSVRVRIAGDRAWLNIKSATLDIVRSEYEYAIPVADGEEMLGMCEGGLIEKERHFVPHGGRTWEIDVFAGENRGLVVAEIELDSADERIDLPPWAGREVSDDVRYYNVYLARHPYKQW